MSSTALLRWFQSYRAGFSQWAAERAVNYLVVVGLCVSILLGVFVEAYLLVLKPLPHYLLEDFGYYTRAYSAASAGGDPYLVRGIGTAFLYPPPALLVIGVFALIPGDSLRAAVFIGANLLLLGLMLQGIARYYALSWQRIWWWVPLSVSFAPLLELLHIGQINLIASFGVFLLFICEESLPFLAGLGLSVAICLKVTPAIFVAYLVVQRRWAVLGWLALFLLGECAAASLLFGARHFVTYADVFTQLLHTFVPGNGNAQALVSVLNERGWLASGQMSLAQNWLSGYLLVIFTVSLLMAVALRQREPVFIVLSLGATIAPNIVWYHHYVFVLLPLLLWMAWSRLHSGVVLWCLGVVLIIQADRRLLTAGLLIHVFIHASIVGLLVWQMAQMVKTADDWQPRLRSALLAIAGRFTARA